MTAPLYLTLSIMLVLSWGPLVMLNSPSDRRD